MVLLYEMPRMSGLRQKAAERLPELDMTAVAKMSWNGLFIHTCANIDTYTHVHTYMYTQVDIQHK